MPDCETTDAISLLRFLKRKYLAKKDLYFAFQCATNCANDIQMYSNRAVVSTKLLKAVHSFVYH